MGRADRQGSQHDRGGGASGRTGRELPWFMEEPGVFGGDAGRLEALRGQVTEGSYDVRSDLLASAILARLGIH